MTLLKGGDLVGAAVAWLIASALTRPSWTLFRVEHLLQAQMRLWHIAAAAVAALIWHLSFASFNLYHSRRLSPQRQELSDVVKATSIGSVLVYGLSTLLPWTSLSVSFFFVFWLTVTAMALMSRATMRWALRFLRKQGRNLRHVLIFGTNDRAIQLAHLFENRTDLGYCLAGFVDDEWQNSASLSNTHFQKVADLSSYAGFLRTHVVDEVAIYLPMRSYYGVIARITEECIAQGIMVRLSADLFDSSYKHVRTDVVDNESIVTVGPSGIYGWAGIVKSTFDRIGSVALLLLLSPLMGAIALAIKLTSRGPVFFTQRRLGLNKRPFRFYKFRTMVADAEDRLAEIEYLNEQDGPVFKIRNDPRMTPLGRFLRKLSLDELPQLLNVVRGDMSLVGPRPLPFRDYEGFSKDWHRRRFSVKPGISCLWQISGRSNIQFEQWMRLDMQYIDEWSFWLDLKILARTIPAVFRGEGAS